MSGFLQNTYLQESKFIAEIDFNEAVRLPDGGSTCELFKTRWQRREVFVKRLKKEFRTNPLYIDALEKEYEIGISLKHPSLPYYRDFYHDYIIMDYIDGQTLADMIKNNDPWLSFEKNIITMFRQLIEVVDYLHRHNVTHCDIKPDNIMITSNNHNVVLIDFDKCYTDSFNDTSGDPALYGLTHKDEGRSKIDFFGIAKVAEKLKANVKGFKFRNLKQFIKECYKEEPNLHSLSALLEYIPKNSKKFYFLSISAICIIFIALFIFLFFLNSKEEVNDDTVSPVINTKIENFHEGHEMEDDNLNLQFKNSSQIEKTFESNPEETSTEMANPDLTELTKKKAEILDKRIKPLFDNLSVGLDNLEELKNKPETSGEELYIGLLYQSENEDETIKEMYKIIYEIFPGLSEEEVWRILGYSKVYTGYKRRATPAEKVIGEEIEKKMNSSMDSTE